MPGLKRPIIPEISSVVEVFKTDIDDPELADVLCSILTLVYPHCKVNVDMHDCDKVLRLEGDMCVSTVMDLALILGVKLDVL